VPASMSRRGVLAGLASVSGCAPLVGSVSPPALPYSNADTSGSPQPFDNAVQMTANLVLTRTPPAPVRQQVVIDPLVNGVTGDQSAATQRIQRQILEVARTSYPQYEFIPFSAQALASTPLVMVGTFTPISTKPVPDRDAFRFCLVMGDLTKGRAVAKAVTKALPASVDITPTVFFRDSPAWTDDALVRSYVLTCQSTKVGDPIAPAYLSGLLTASIISDAIEAYAAARYAEALELYRNAQRTQAGDQLRVHNGIYLANWRLKKPMEAESAFGELVDYSLNNKRLAVKLLFRSGSTGLVETERGLTDMWLRQIAAGAVRQKTCLQVSGHTSRTGSAALNQQLSLVRAEYIKSRLEESAPALRGKLIAAGMGASQNLVGTAADDASDALDRRVEFRIVDGCA